MRRITPRSETNRWLTASCFCKKRENGWLPSTIYFSLPKMRAVSAYRCIWTYLNLAVFGLRTGCVRWMNGSPVSTRQHTQLTAVELWGTREYVNGARLAPDTRPHRSIDEGLESPSLESRVSTRDQHDGIDKEQLLPSVPSLAWLPGASNISASYCPQEEQVTRVYSPRVHARYACKLPALPPFWAYYTSSPLGPLCSRIIGVTWR